MRTLPWPKTWSHRVLLIPMRRKRPSWLPLHAIDPGLLLITLSYLKNRNISIYA